MSNDFDEKITPYEDGRGEVRPPCHEELMAQLFDIYKTGKTLSGGKLLTPVDRIRDAYPELGESELEQLIQYLDAAEQFCRSVSSCFASCCRTPFIPRTEEGSRNMARVIQVCQNRYAWMSREQIEYILSSVCWLSNR